MRRVLGGTLVLLWTLARGAAGGSLAPGALAPSAVAPDTGSDSLKAFRADTESPDAHPEPVLVELQIGRVASRTVSAYRVGGDALVPVTALLQLGEAGYHLSLDGRIEATINPGGLRLVIDALRDTMRLGARRVPIEPRSRVFRDNELYVSARRLGELFESRILVDWGELTVTLLEDGRLPVGQRLRRDAARAAFWRRTHGAEPERALGLERPQWDGLVVDYSFLAAGEQPLGGGAYSAALGTDAWGGSLEFGVQSVGPTGDGHGRGAASWTGVWRDARWLQQLRLGDGFTTGPRVRPERGVLLTNAPYLRPSLLGAMHYDGRLDLGWTVEAYRGGELVALDSTDTRGRFAVALPVQYGENPVDFVAYGPLGEVREFNRTYHVLNELLPAHRFEYGLAAGWCTTPTCRATGNLDLHYGVTDRWTVRAGVEQFWRAGSPNRAHPYLSTVLNPSNAVALRIEAVGGASATADMQYEPSLNLRLAASYTAYTRDTAPALFRPGLRSVWALNGFVRPLPASGFFFLNGVVSGTRTAVATTTTARLDASVQAQDVRLVPFVRLQRDATADGVVSTRPFGGLDAFALPRPALGPVLGSVWLRAHVEQQLSGALQAAQLFAARPLWPGVRLEVGVGRVRGTPGATFTFTLSSDLPAVRALTLVSAPTVGGPATASQFVQGSVLWNRSDGRLTYTPGPSLERAGLVGRVFLDEDGNGRRDPGEPAVPGVRVLVGTMSSSSDSNGWFRVWDLVPFEPVLVTVDSLSIDSPLLVPAFGSASVVLGPNRFRSFDIPLVRAGVVEGRVVHAAGGATAGVPLVLTNRRSGERRRFTTFTDGAFYMLGVKAGDYELAIDPRALDLLHATAAPLRITLTPTAAGVGATGLELLLTSKP